jgi:hypothetical protein
MATTEELQKDFTELIDRLTGSAQNLLQKSGEFYPIGGVITVIGTFEYFDVLTDDEKPPVKEVIEKLSDALTAGLRDKRFRAFAVCANATVVVPTTGKMMDALRITAHHESGRTVVYILPYRKKGEKYEFREGYFQ